MKTTDNTSHEPVCIACPSCDLVFDVSSLNDGETARCSRCQHFLTTYRADELNRVMAYTISSLILLILACSYPFLELESSGLKSMMTLPETASKLWQYDMQGLAFIVASFIIFLPAFILILVLALVGALIMEWRYSWLRPVGRLIYTLQNWAMVDVFFIGVLVSLVKVGGMASMSMGISFWAYAVFSILYILSVYGLDRAQCWHRIEALSES
ncbi:MAG: paraquat-inducible protein A [Porticoccus sp.]|nr:paraquat-inducible protein A [Porticoccus sp.]